MRIFGKKIKINPAKDKKKAMPDGLWSKCPSCEQLIFNKILDENLRVCNKCDYHFPLTCWERVRMLADEDSFRELAAELESGDPLNFQGPKSYKEKIIDEQRLTQIRVSSWGRWGRW